MAQGILPEPFTVSQFHSLFSVEYLLEDTAYEAEVQHGINSNLRNGLDGSTTITFFTKIKGTKNYDAQLIINMI